MSAGLRNNNDDLLGDNDATETRAITLQPSDVKQDGHEKLKNVKWKLSINDPTKKN